MAPTKAIAESDGWKSWQVALMVGVPISVVGGAYLYRRYKRKVPPPDTPPEPVAEAKKFKTQGNEHFKAGRYTSAIDCYSRAIELEGSVTSDELSTFFQNRAAAYDQLQNHFHVIKDCTKAISLNPKYIKALSRRARAYHVTGYLNEALEDVTAACVLEGFSITKNVQLADVIIKEVCQQKADEKMKVRVPKDPSANQVSRFVVSFTCDPVFNSPEYNSLLKRSKVANSNDLDFNRSSYKRALIAFINHDYSNIVDLCNEEINNNNNNNKNNNNNDDGYNSNVFNKAQDSNNGVVESGDNNNDNENNKNNENNNNDNNEDNDNDDNTNNEDNDNDDNTNNEDNNDNNEDGLIKKDETKVNDDVNEEDDGIDIKENGDDDDNNDDDDDKNADNDDNESIAYNYTGIPATASPTSDMPASTTTSTTVTPTTEADPAITSTATPTTVTSTTTTPTTEADPTITSTATSTTTATTRNFKYEARLLKATFKLLRCSMSEAVKELSAIIDDAEAAVKVRSNSLLKRAKAHTCEDRMRDAFNDYMAAEALDRQNADVYLHRGQFHLVNERLEEAVSDFERCLTLETNAPEPYIHKTFTESRKALLEGNSGQMSKLLDDFAGIIKKFPDYAEAHVFHGQALQDVQRLEEAEDCYLRAIKLDANNSNGYVHHGVFRITWRNDLEGGLDLIRKGVSVDPSNAFAYQALGTILFQKGDIEAAISNVNKAIENVSSKGEMAHLFTILEAANVQTKVASKLGVNLNHL